MQQIKKWYTQGDVLILGYESFRNLINTDDEDSNLSIEDKMLNKYLISPGADLIVCDEGHLLKNENTSKSKALSHIHTMRRIILTGTPLQNNLKEYYCMVNFMKPYLLGTMKEFSNRFLNPIQNGQYLNSTEADIDLMNRRSYVLNQILDGCIQRCGIEELEKFLPPRTEYVLSCKLSKWQAALYKVISLI